MSFVPRALIRPSRFLTRRSYSFLSNKPGRSWFNGSKATTAKQQPRQQTPAQQQQAAPVIGRDAQERDGVEISVDGYAEGKPVSEVKKTTTAAQPPEPAPLAVSITNALTWPSPTLPPTDHPQPTLSSLTLQRFYSVDRPLLSVNLPLSSPSHNSSEEADKEAEADAARLLAHSLVMNKLGAEKDWEDVIAKLEGRVQEETVYQRVSMDSVKRKRRKKMAKHKYKKRRRLQRAERKRLGK